MEYLEKTELHVPEKTNDLQQMCDLVKLQSK
jgi:hypothetical protein